MQNKPKSGRKKRIIKKKVALHPFFKLLFCGMTTIFFISLISPVLCVLLIKNNTMWRDDVLECLIETRKYSGSFIMGLLGGKVTK